MELVYIAGPMSGYPRWNKAEFDHAESIIALRGQEPINPFNLSPVPEKDSHEFNKDDFEILWRDCMRRAVTALAKSDKVVVLNGWEKSRGARVEVQLALDLGIPVETLGMWRVSQVPPKEDL
jgi:hypothetical protein